MVMCSAAETFTSDLPDQRDEMPDLVQLTAPCCGRKLRGAKLMLVATTNVRRTCCGNSWSITIRPMKADPYRGVAVHQIDWTRYVGPTLPPTWETEQ